MMKYLLLFMFPILFACSKSGGEEKREPLKIATPKMEITIGQSAKIEHNGVSPLYTVENDFYIDVDNAGIVKAKKVGSVAVKVSATNGSGTVDVSVLPTRTNVIDPIDLLQKPLNAITAKYGTEYKTKKDGSLLFKIQGNIIDSLVFTFANGVCTKISSFTLSNNKSSVVDFLNERYLEGKANQVTDFIFSRLGTKTIIWGILRDVPTRPDLKNYEMLYFDN